MPTKFSAFKNAGPIYYNNYIMIWNESVDVV